MSESPVSLHQGGGTLAQAVLASAPEGMLIAPIWKRIAAFMLDVMLISIILTFLTNGQLTLNLLNFELLRKEVLETIPNFTNINDLPSFKETKIENVSTNFISEKIYIKELDYFFTNSISRASKTMSECRQIRQKSQKTGTDNI